VGIGMPSPHPTSRTDGPTRKQLRYLRELAAATGQTFTSPQTKVEASAEIRRLQQTSADSRLDREVERDRLECEVALPVDAAAVRDDEITGHGASARWANRPAERPPRNDRQHELARYELPGGNVRALVADRIQGRVAITDMPKNFAGRVYLVERHVESKAEMDGLVAVYVEDSRRRGEPAVLLPVELGA
jgi:hypothetical protein